MADVRNDNMKEDETELVGHINDNDMDLVLELVDKPNVSTNRQQYLITLKKLMIKHDIKKIDVALVPMVVK